LSDDLCLTVDDLTIHLVVPTISVEIIDAVATGGTPPIVVALFVSDPAGEPVPGGNGLFSFAAPPQLDNRALVSVWASVVSAPSSNLVVQLANPAAAYDYLTTPITVETGELTTSTAASQPVIDVSSDRNQMATGQVIRVDIDTVSAAVGLQIVMSFA
jgi:hypothetical protein